MIPEWSIALIYFAVIATASIFGLRTVFEHKSKMVTEQVKQKEKEMKGLGGFNGMLTKGIEFIDEKLNKADDGAVKRLEQDINDAKAKGATSDQLSSLERDLSLAKLALKVKPAYDKLGGKGAVAEIVRWGRRQIM